MEVRSERRRGPQGAGIALLGLGLLVLGSLLVLDLFDALDAGRVLSRWWPTILVVVGGLWLWSGSRLGGGLALGAAVYLLLATNSVLPDGAGNVVGPALLIGLGIIIVVAGLRIVRVPAGAGRLPPVTFDSREWSGGSRDFDGATITALFGDARLRINSEPDHDRAMNLASASLFGDVVIEVPAGWRIRDRVTTVFGSVRFPVEQPSTAEAPILEVGGFSIFGDLDVRYKDL